MPDRGGRRRAWAVVVALAFAFVPAPAPASAFTVARVMEWRATGTWGCNGCHVSTGFQLEGASGTCGQTGFHVESGASPQVAAEYPCTASFSGDGSGICTSGVCALKCCLVDVQVSDPTAGTVLEFTVDAQGALARSGDQFARVLHLTGSQVSTASPSTVWHLDADLFGYGCSTCSAAVALSFAMTVTQVSFEPV